MRWSPLVLLCGAALALRAPAQTMPAVTEALYTASVHTFSVLRSGVAVDDSVTGIRHAASHTGDATAATDPAGARDLSGGWYNAGDYGKWPNMAAITVSYMLHLYTAQERAAARGLSRYPPDPALLAEARWGLAWVLKMQDPDGGVRHKIDGATHASLAAAWGKAPEEDTTVRLAAAASTGSTADSAAVLYQAARFFEHRDPEEAHKLRAAADRAWAWVEAHPNVPAHDLFYVDHAFAGEILWAQAERAVTRHQDVAALVDVIASRAQPEVSWLDPSLLGLYSLATSPAAPRSLRLAARAKILLKASTLAEAAARRPFRVALGPDDFWWGSAERVLHRASLLLMADALAPSATLRAAAADQLAWVLGNNAADHSFVTAFGAHPVLHPWHWTYRVYGVLLPGWAVGGPNASPEWADPALKKIQAHGTPAGACYTDRCDREGSWASNEGQISEEAALVFVTGMLRVTPPPHSPSR